MKFNKKHATLVGMITHVFWTLVAIIVTIAQGYGMDSIQIITKLIASTLLGATTGWVIATIANIFCKEK